MFDASAETILSELLQNARRAGSTHIDITVKMTSAWDAQITIKDNGQGIENPAIILSYGENDWENDTTVREDAAGMGFACLANNGCRIMSKTRDTEGWQTSLDKLCFSGEKTATIKPWINKDQNHGTTVTFNLHWTLYCIRQTIKDVTKYFPVNTTLHTEELGKKTSENMKHEGFLDHSFYTEEWLGLRIGVHNTQNIYNIDEDLNFFGHQLKINAAKLTDLNNNTWYARVDVIACSKLELVLPARKEAINNDFMRCLKQKCKAIIYRGLNNNINTGPVFLGYREITEAATLGISLPIMPPGLIEWKPKVDDSTGNWPKYERKSLPENAFLVNSELNRSLQHSLGHALERDNKKHLAFEPNPEMAGFDWYDNLFSIESVIPHITIGNRIQPLNTFSREELYDRDKPRDVKEALLQVQLEDGHKNTRVELIDTPIILTGEPYDWGDESECFIVDKTQWSSSMLIQLLEDAYFEYRADADANNYDTQKDEFEESARYYVHTLLNEGPEEIATTIKEILIRHNICSIEEGKELCFSLQIHTGGINVTHQTAAESTRIQ